MRPEEISVHLRTLPFDPIRVFVSDGSSYDVLHPDLMLVSHRQVAIGVKRGKGDLPQRLAYVNPVPMTRIKPINGRKPDAGRRTRRSR